MVHWGSRLFVFVVFSLLAIAFWGQTVLLYLEFSLNWKDPEFESTLWFDLLTHYSHLFLFFPLFGTVALAAFFLPAAVFVEMYWRKPPTAELAIPGGRPRFIFGFFVVAFMGWLTALGLEQGDEIGLWQIKADVLRKDGRIGRDCAERDTSGKCIRLRAPLALANVRLVSQQREQLTDLTRDCSPDPLIEPTGTATLRRFCFVTARYSPKPADLASKLLNDAQCCRALDRFEAHIRDTYAKGEDFRSWVDRVQPVTLPMNAFFLFVLLAISILLAARRRRIEAQYAEIAHRIDRGVIIGAVAMLFLPFMNHAYLLSSELIYGPNQPLLNDQGVSFYRVPHVLSVAFAIWGFFILLFFVNREDKDAERASKIMGFVASGVFVLKYDLILNYAVRFAGPGAGTQSVFALATIACTLIIALVVLKMWVGKPLGPTRA